MLAYLTNGYEILDQKLVRNIDEFVYLNKAAAILSFGSLWWFI